MIMSGDEFDKADGDEEVSDGDEAEGPPTHPENKRSLLLVEESTSTGGHEAGAVGRATKRTRR